MTADEKEQATLWVRVRPEIIEALDALGEAMGRDAMAFPAGPPARVDVARMALSEGIKAMQLKLKRGDR